MCHIVDTKNKVRPLQVLLVDTSHSTVCKTCGHAIEDHKGTAMVCMKQMGKDPTELCDCYSFDDGKTHVLP